MTTRDWIEIKADRMIRKSKSSQFAADIFRDAREFHAHGYARDVALMMALRLWEGHPQTGRVQGVDQ
jgi:hypothetical protein